jgi:subtilisin family serine protease
MARSLSVLLSLLWAVLFAPAPALAQRPTPVPIADELLVGFRGGVTPAAAEGTYRRHGGFRLGEIRRLNVHRIRVPAPALGAVERALRHDPHVKFVERHRLLPPDLDANDPLFRHQWHLTRIGAHAAWDITPGARDVVIAILDTGVDPQHEDLRDRLVPGWNFYDNNADTSDVYGHGTKVAGAAAAAGDNGLGIASPSMASAVMPIRVTGTHGWASDWAIAQGLMWAVDHGARVMNLSFAGVAESSTILNAAKYVFDRGGIVVAAAGNCGCDDPTPPTPWLLSVGATDGQDALASFSSRGAYVDMTAPGVGILTTTAGNGYGAVSGTSFSSPITAGVLALMLAANRALGPSDLETVLAATSVDLGAPGWDAGFGHGRIDALAAVSAAASSAPVPDTTPPAVAITSPASGATLSGTVPVAVEASDDRGVSRVDLYVDGVFHASDSTAPLGFAWDTTGVADGPHALTAVAVDADGNSATSATVSVWVSNQAARTEDTAPPEVAVSSVVQRGKHLRVRVTATDNVAVASVSLYANGTLVRTLTSAPYDFRVDTRGLPAGSSITLRAEATDTAGNVGVAAPVTVAGR